MHTRDGWREQLGSRPPCEWTEPEGVQGDDPPLPCGMRLGPGVRAAGSREPGAGASSPGGRGPHEQRLSPLGTPGPPPTLRLISPPGSEAHPEAPTPKARLLGSCTLGSVGSRCSAPGRVSGSSVVVPSLAEKDPEEQ